MNRIVEAVGAIILGPIRELPTATLRRVALVAAVRALRSQGVVVTDAQFREAERLCKCERRFMDENDLLRAGKLPRDPEADARPMRAPPRKRRSR